jgi:integrase
MEVKNAKPRERTYKLSDEKGMYLEVTRKGHRYWRLKYRFGGKEKKLSLGVYPDVSLSQAREMREQARAQLSDGIDPCVAKKASKLQGAKGEPNSFRVIALEWFDIKMGGKSRSYRERSWRALENNLFPDIGDRPITQITVPELLVPLRKVEERGAIEMAKRTKQVAGLVFRYAIATGRAERDISRDIGDALRPSVKKHYASITDPKRVGRLMVAIDGYDGTPSVKSALKLSPLLFTRPGEIRHMEWSEINWDESRWEIPAAKMKMRQDHIVPLATQALAILKAQQAITGDGKYVHPSPRGKQRPLSDNGVRTALRTMGYGNDDMTAHGFRAMARTMLDEILEYPHAHIELQLAHKPPGALGAAYNRSSYLKQRMVMMQVWADYLDGLKAKVLAGEF